MSLQVWVRPFNAADPKEKRLLLEWLYAGREKNRFDPEIFKRGQVAILTCFTREGIVGFVPVSLAFLLESLAFKPGLSPITEAKALLAVQHHLVHRAFEQNVPDAFFFTRDETVLKLSKAYGWVVPDVPFLNFHFADLEHKDESDNQPDVEH